MESPGPPSPIFLEDQDAKTSDEEEDEEEAVTWFTFFCHKEQREYYYEPMAGRTTWILPADAVLSHLPGSPQENPPPPLPVHTQQNVTSKLWLVMAMIVAAMAGFSIGCEYEPFVSSWWNYSTATILNGDLKLRESFAQASSRSSRSLQVASESAGQASEEFSLWWTDSSRRLMDEVGTISSLSQEFVSTRYNQLDESIRKHHAIGLETVRQHSQSASQLVNDYSHYTTSLVEKATGSDNWSELPRRAFREPEKLVSSGWQTLRDGLSAIVASSSLTIEDQKCHDDSEENKSQQSSIDLPDLKESKEDSSRSPESRNAQNSRENTRMRSREKKSTAAMNAPHTAAASGHDDELDAQRKSRKPVEKLSDNSIDSGHTRGTKDELAEDSQRKSWNPLKIGVDTVDTPGSKVDNTVTSTDSGSNRRTMDESDTQSKSRKPLKKGAAVGPGHTPATKDDDVVVGAKSKRHAAKAVIDTESDNHTLGATDKLTEDTKNRWRKPVEKVGKTVVGAGPNHIPEATDEWVAGDEKQSRKSDSTTVGSTESGSGTRDKLRQNDQTKSRMNAGQGPDARAGTESKRSPGRTGDEWAGDAQNKSRKPGDNVADSVVRTESDPAKGGGGDLGRSRDRVGKVGDAVVSTESGHIPETGGKLVEEAREISRKHGERVVNTDVGAGSDQDESVGGTQKNSLGAESDSRTPSSGNKMVEGPQTKSRGSLKQASSTVSTGSGRVVNVKDGLVEKAQMKSSDDGVTSSDRSTNGQEESEEDGQKKSQQSTEEAADTVAGTKSGHTAAGQGEIVKDDGKVTREPRVDTSNTLSTESDRAASVQSELIDNAASQVASPLDKLPGDSNAAGDTTSTVKSDNLASVDTDMVTDASPGNHAKEDVKSAAESDQFSNTRKPGSSGYAEKVVDAVPGAGSDHSLPQAQLKDAYRMKESSVSPGVGLEDDAKLELHAGLSESDPMLGKVTPIIDLPAFHSPGGEKGNLNVLRKSEAGVSSDETDRVIDKVAAGSQGPIAAKFEPSTPVAGEELLVEGQRGQQKETPHDQNKARRGAFSENGEAESNNGAIGGYSNVDSATGNARDDGNSNLHGRDAMENDSNADSHPANAINKRNTNHSRRKSELPHERDTSKVLNVDETDADSKSMQNGSSGVVNDAYADSDSPHSGGSDLNIDPGMREGKLSQEPGTTEGDNRGGSPYDATFTANAAKSAADSTGGNSLRGNYDHNSIEDATIEANSNVGAGAGAALEAAKDHLNNPIYDAYHCPIDGDAAIKPLVDSHSVGHADSKPLSQLPTSDAYSIAPGDASNVSILERILHSARAAGLSISDDTASSSRFFRPPFRAAVCSPGSKLSHCSTTSSTMS